MPTPKPISVYICNIIFLLILRNAGLAKCKSTIEPCSFSDSCNAMLGYTLYTDLKVAEVAALFAIDPIALLTANAIDISYPDVENHILPSQLFLKIPITCSCADGIRKSVITYKTRPSDTLSAIAGSFYGGLVSADQIQDANSLPDDPVLESGQTLTVPLTCTCFNSTDNSLPAIYLSYVVKPGDSLNGTGGIAARYSTTLTDIMNVNAMGNPSIAAGDILAIPLPACASNFTKYASDNGLLVATGSYSITAGHCVQCSCGPGNLNLYCAPSPLAVSCSSMQCRNSKLMLGNVTAQQSSAGCNVNSCSYDGTVNGTIWTTLSTSLQPRCPGSQQFIPLIAPPTTVNRGSIFAPSPSPSQSSAVPAAMTPKSSVTSSPGSIPGFTPANGPMGSASDACILTNALASFPTVIVLCLFFKFMVPFLL